MTTHRPPAPRRAAARRGLPRSGPAAALLCAALLAGGCSTAPATLVQGPVSAPPTPAPLYVERVNNGAIFKPGMMATAGSSPFSGRRRPSRIGDTLKVDISESLSASNTVKTETSRATTLASNGPGSSSSPYSLIRGLMDQNLTASGSDTFKGNGTSKNDSSFSGQLAASVINVLANGNLVVAGERSVALNGGVNTLRFSGIVDPRDLQDGNVVASSDVVNARLEVVGKGDVSDAGRRNWLQRVLANSLSVW